MSDRPADRRQFPRAPVDVKVCLLTDRRPGAAIDGQAVDLSEGGFGLMVDTLIVVDSDLSVSAARAPDGPRVTARVASRTPVGGRWRLGCEFPRPLSDADLAVFRAADPPTPPADPSG